MDRRHPARLLATLAAPLALLAACGGAAPAPARVAPSAAAPGTALATPQPDVTPPPAPEPPAPSAKPPLAAVPVVMPAQPIAVSSTTFPIRPLVAGGPSGAVTVTTADGAVRYHIVVRGLVPGSAHAIHDHLGFCGDAGVSDHLRVLAIVTADPSGTAAVDTAVPMFDAGAGRIVIVYASPSPALITGCADL